MDKMNNIANLFGLNLNQEFRCSIAPDYSLFKFTEQGLEYRDLYGKHTEWELLDLVYFHRLIIGKEYMF